jgi:hypothetical protein
MIVAVGLFWETQAQKVIASTLWAMPRHPIPSRLGFRFSHKAYPVLW